VLLHALRKQGGTGEDAQEPGLAHVEDTLLQVGGRGFVQAVPPVVGLCTLAARCDARLLVVGARRLGRLSVLFGRSVSTRITSVADRPVVVVPQAYAHGPEPAVLP
jgi:nucleotide-binding universal stress UspA family protein